METQSESPTADGPSSPDNSRRPRGRMILRAGIALVQEGSSYTVYAEDGGSQVKHKVELGQRGPVRSEIKGGLAPGARILLVPPTDSKT